MDNNRIIRIFTMPQQFPCGPQSSCCGPIGQSEEEIQKLKDVIKRELKLDAEVVNLLNGDNMKNHLSIVRLFRSFGPMATPIIAIGEEVACMGSPAPKDVVSAIKEKLKQI